jgi:acyl-CoA synthetase (AMP-forming)/AMP-acid ligase II
LLAQLVRNAAAGSPDRALVISGKDQLTYGDCLRRSEALARGLQTLGIDRFGCVFAASADTVLALIASATIGVEACVYPRDPGSDGHPRLAARFDHRIVLTDQPTRIEGVEARTLAEVGAAGEPDAAAPGPVPPAAQFPVLILTTGTTGEQKGARHDWVRLLRAVRHQGLRSDTRWLLAYNINQFAGIQVFLHALVSGGTLVEPVSRQADDVIGAIREHRVTHASATPTLWRLLAGRLDVERAAELPLEQITLGGEAAPEGLLRRLRELFPEAQISHVYAGTEVGSIVSVSDGRSGLPVSVLERDEHADVQLRIIDDELHIRSRVGMLGYHQGAEESRGWRATGDLVAVRDGRIQFVGRTTEIINVGGAKIHPLPVEEVVGSVEGVELAAVYGRPNPVTGQIVAVDIIAAPSADTDELEQRIREACAGLPAAARPRRIRFVPELDIRGSKLMRREV